MSEQQVQEPKTVKQQYLELQAATPDIVDFTYYEYLQKRQIVLNQDIDDSILELATLQIRKFNEEDEGIPVEQRKPITIILCTYGGSVFEGMALVDEIENSITPVHIEVKGIAASMGSLILMAGHHRKITKHGVVLIHDGSMFVGGTTSKVRDQVKFQEDREEQIKQYILAKTKIDDETYDRQYQKEWYLTAEDALKYGIIDEIVGKKTV
jgi:ATP-dependent Clp protease protease subunit